MDTAVIPKPANARAPRPGCQRWLALGAFLASSASAQVATQVTFDASANVLDPAERDEIVSHTAEAMRRWSRLLAIDGPRSIEVRVSITDQATASAASAVGIPVGEAEGRQLLEQSVAYELRTGVDPNGADPDMYLQIGLDYLRNTLWFDPDPGARSAPVPSNRTDAMSTFLHEVGHAVAYNGWSDATTGIPPATLWSTFDRWMIPGSPTLFSGANAVAAWGVAPDLTTGNNKHWGNGTAIAAPRVEWQPARPVEWRNGLAVPPLAPAPPSMSPAVAGIAAQDSLILQLMNGVVFYSGHRYDISPLDVAVLRDVGLPLDALFANGFD